MASEIERTHAYGDEAVAQLKSNMLPAVPRNYELWYTYASGYNQSLNAAVNSKLRASGKITDSDLMAIYNQYLAPLQLGEKIDEVSDSLSGEISGIIKQVEASLKINSSYGSNLSDAANQLNGAQSIAELTALVEFLTTETAITLQANRQLEDQLQSSQRQVAELRDEFEAIRTQTLTDELTSLSNRRHFDHTLRRLISDAEETGEIFSLIITDIDHFKKFNDTFGHQTGDQVLRLVAIAVRQNIKGKDLACRYGGEEFAILLPGTDVNKACIVAEHARKSVMSKQLVKRSTGENLGRITISAGVTEYQAGDSIESIVERADQFMYAAKHSGRNMVKSDDVITPREEDDEPESEVA